MYIAGRELKHGEKTYQLGDDVAEVVASMPPYVIEANKRCGTIREVTAEQAEQMRAITRAQILADREAALEKERQRKAGERCGILDDIAALEKALTVAQARLEAFDVAARAASADPASSARGAQHEDGQGTSEARPRDDLSPGDGVAVTIPSPITPEQPTELGATAEPTPVTEAPASAESIPDALGQAVAEPKQARKRGKAVGRNRKAARAAG